MSSARLTSVFYAITSSNYPSSGRSSTRANVAAWRLASLRELLPIVRTEFHNRSPGVAFRVFRTSVSPARIHE